MATVHVFGRGPEYATVAFDQPVTQLNRKDLEELLLAFKDGRKAYKAAWDAVPYHSS
jgi:hypothetical protein